MNWASSLAALALIGFLAAITTGALSILDPDPAAYKLVGLLSLFSGLLIMAAAVALEFTEILLARHELRDETADLDEHVRVTSLS